MKKLSLLAFLLLLGSALRAVPAYNDWIDFLQPHSKQTIRILLLGDERVHWAESEEGYSLLYGEGGDLHYAQPDGQGGMEPSPYLATPKELRAPEVDHFLATLKPHLRFSQKQVDQLTALWKQVESQASKSKTMSDVLGEKKFLVILFAFQDQAFTHSKNEFKNLFNQVGYTANNSTGSVHDYYYYQVSHGQFSLSVDIVGPFTGTRETAFYGNTDNGYQAFATEAVDSAAKYVDFSQYDNDHDGYIDGLHIIFAGVGEEAGGGEDKIWSHKWNIFSEPTYNNTIINVYSCSPERAGSGNTSEPGASSLTAIGVICHELGHVFGAPDYYDTDYAGSGGEYPGLGKWDIMSSGSWNRGGKTPASHNPYTKIYIYHWADCDTLTDQQVVQMQPVTRSNTDFHRINTSTEGDFFLLENRMKESWDGYIPGSGMLVYHIHPDAHGPNVANYRHPQQIYILAFTQDSFPTEYPSSYGDLGSVNATYPANGRRTELTDHTAPWLRPWSGQPNNTPITHISQNPDGTVFFCFKGAQPSSSNLTAEGVSDESVRLDWNNYGNMKSLVLYSTEPRFPQPEGRLRVGDTIEGAVVGATANASTLCVRGLDPTTHYYFRLFNMPTDTTYLPVYLDADATTLACASTPWRLETFDSLDAMPDCWLADGWRLANYGGSNPCLAASDRSCTLVTAPIDMTGYTPTATVATFVARFYDPTESSASLTLRIRAGISSDWEELITVRASDCPDGWTRFAVPVSAASDYTLLQFQFSHGVATRNTVFLDSVALTHGYRIYAHCTSGGTITHPGYHVLQPADTMSFQAIPDEHYRIGNLYINGENRTSQLSGGRYLCKANRHMDIHFVFFRTNDIDPQPEAQPLRVYPNPTTGELRVESGELRVELYDMMGRRLVSTDEHTLDLSSLPNGMYLLRCGSQTQKIIKR